MKRPYPPTLATGWTGNPPLVLELLRYAATASSSDATYRIAFRRLAEVDERQFQWVLKAGLGPLLYSATDEVDQVPAARRDILRSADLTAQVRHGNFVDAANEIIDACRDIGVRVTLLKGISTSDQYYPAPHLRPMGDIDILVCAEAQESVESEIVRRGFTRVPDDEADGDSYHGVPLFHPHRGVWVEVHNALFPRQDSLRRNSVFSPPHLDDHSLASTFQGRPVHRFSAELQLLYIASFWIRDLSRQGIYASYLPPLFDAVYLLKNLGRPLDWEGLLGSLDNDMAMASLYIMLVHLSRCGLHEFPLTVMTHLGENQETVGDLELNIIHFMLSNYLIQGRPFTRLFQSWHVLDNLLTPGSAGAKLLLLPWNIVFPPRVKDRYSLRYQLERVHRLVRGQRS